MTKMNWRLKTLPTPDEVRELVKDKIITQEEAREILFAKENETDRDVKSPEAEIKFLRELVEKLSTGRSNIIETIKYIEKPYHQYQWYQPYQVWCGNRAGNTLYTYTSGTATTAGAATNGESFSSINTF